MTNYSNLPSDLQDKLEKWDKNSPVQKQLQALNDCADMLQDLLRIVTEDQKSDQKNVQNFGALLIDMRDALNALKSKEDPTAPDYATPVITAMNKLETALTAAIKGIKVTPEFSPNITVDSPSVNVSAPDFSKVEKLLKTEMPKAFKEAIALIPTPKPEDNTDELDRLETIISKLESIDTATRMKPQFPNSMAINGSVNTLSPSYATKITVVGTVTYIAMAAAGSAQSDPVWRAQKIDETSGTTITWADGNTNFDNVATDLTVLTYT